MDPQPLTLMANKFPSALDATLLNERGHQLAFVQRQRPLTPFRFGLSVIASMATPQVPRIAALPRDVKDLWDSKSTSKAFSQQWAKASWAEFLRASLGDGMGKWTRKALGVAIGPAWSAFNRVVRQEGSSVALHEALADGFPGRVRSVKPAAVELHGPMDGLQEAPLTLVLSPDTDCAHDSRPAPATLQGDGFLADRGSLALASRRAIDRHGGFCIVRAKADLNPQVHGAFREEGKRLKSAQRRDVKAIVSTLPKRQRPPCLGAWRLEREPFALRLIVRGHPQTKALDSLFTNLAPSRYSIHSVCLGDKLRGQVERLVTAGKSPAHLHAFETEKETLAEALIWASLGAAALTRCWAHAAESLLEGVISTHKAAMSPAYGFPEWCRSLWQGDGPWDRRAFARMIG